MRMTLLLIAIFSLSLASAQQNEFINIRERVEKRIELLRDPSSADIFPARLGCRSAIPSLLDDPYYGMGQMCFPSIYLKSAIKWTAYYVSVSNNGVEFMREKLKPAIMPQISNSLISINFGISSGL